MRTLLKILLALVVLIIICAGAGVAYLFARYPDVPPPETITVQSTPEKVARGEYLANNVTGCIACHAIRDMTKYGGPLKPGTDGAGGELFGEAGSGFEVYSKNITPEGIGNWTDGQLIPMRISARSISTCDRRSR